MIVAKVKNIYNNGELNLLELDFYSQHLTMIALELNPNITMHSTLSLNIKASSVSLTTLDTPLSHENKIKAKIHSISKSTLLSSVVLNIDNKAFLETIVPRKSFEKLNLNNNDEVIALINPTHISIAKEL